MTSEAVEPRIAVGVDEDVEGLRGLGARVLENVKGGNLGSWPVVIGIAVVVLVFGITAQNFFTAVNFNNIVVQMAGVTLLAYGVVFVLLLGEIDLSIAYVSAVAGVVAAELQLPASGHELPGLLPIVVAILAGIGIGAFQGSFVALIGVPSFVVTLAGLLAWQGLVQNTLGAGGPIIIQNHFINQTAQYFLPNTAGWIVAAVVTAAYVGGMAASTLSARRHGVAIRNPALLAVKAVAVPVAAFGVVAISNHDRGLPFAGLLIVAFLLFWTYIAKRTMFGRHVYAVGGNAEAARRAGINVPRIRIFVFMISGGMSALGGIVLAGRLSSVAPDQGGGTLLLDAISAAVIGGMSLFGGRGEVRSAVLGAALISIIANGLFIFQISNGIIFMITGGILLFAVTLDTLARRRQAKTGR